MQRVRSHLFVICATSLLVGYGLAQDASTGALRGTVADAAGARIGSATVALVNNASGLRYSAETDATGRFVIELLRPGDYVARATSDGMSPQVTPNLHIEVNGTTEMAFTLSVAGTQETVTVSGAPQLVETQPTASSSYLDERAISDLPLNGRRYTDLALLAPGVTQDPRGMTSSSNGDLSFGGIRGYQSSYLVDGADNNNAFFGQARGRYRAPYQFSNEVVQEFRVSSNTYGAELGRAGGAVVNVVTKSGSNHLHGTAFYYIRDSAFNAQHAYLDYKPADRQQQFGFTLGGPIRRNHAFFFAGFDQHIFHVPIVMQFANGSSVIVPQKGAEPLHHGDYEESDRTLVFDAAARLSHQSGQYPSAQIGNTAFAKVDFAVTPKNYVSARFNSSRYYGQNNVFLDPTSPLTTYAISDNGEEDVATQTGNLSLTTGLSPRLISHLRGQLSHDLQQSYANSMAPQVRIYGLLDGLGRSTILPRKTNERRFHLTETLSLDTGRNAWKLGGDALLTWIDNYFPSVYGGEYFFDDIRVNPFTFQPETYGMKLTPLRAYAHAVPRYYIQNFGSPDSHPNTDEYAGFLQDTVRLTSRLGASLGVRYDLQTFTHEGLRSNPLWPASGRVPLDTNNFSPRIGLAYSVGDTHPLVIRAGYGMFYTRIPQIYTSAIATDNGFNSFNLQLSNSDFYQRQLFPHYPYPLVSCTQLTAACLPPSALSSYMQADISSFAGNFKTPKVEQASLNLERELADRFAAGVSYMWVHGEDLIRARDGNLPSPITLDYPVYDNSETNLLGYYNVQSFSTWQTTRSLTCPYPPCINALQRPVPQLGAVNVFESAASSVYNGLTFSLRRRMSSGIYFRLAYTYAHAIDSGADALVAGRPSLVQNSYTPNAERASSVTDQRHRLVLSWIGEPRPFDRAHTQLSRVFNDWKLSGVVTVGSGRPVDARVTGDPNQDGNSYNDRLPGYSRNAFTGPDYATTDLRLSRRLFLHQRTKLDLMLESFNVLNRDNKRLILTDDGLQSNAVGFVPYSNSLSSLYYPGFYRKPTNFLKPSDAYAPRQVQLALKLTF